MQSAEWSSWTATLRSLHRDKCSRIAITCRVNSVENEHYSDVSVLMFKKHIDREMPEPEYWTALLEKIQIEERNEVVKEDIRDQLNASLSAFRHAKDLIGSIDPTQFAIIDPHLSGVRISIREQKY